MSDLSPTPEAPGMTPLQQLEILVGHTQTHTVLINGELVKIEIGRVKTGTIPKVIAAAGSLMVYLTDHKYKLDLRNLLILHPNECLDLLAVLIKKDRATVDELELDDTLMILGHLLEINMGFFVHRVFPVLSGELQRLFVEAKSIAEKLKSITGQTSSPASSATATENLTSGSTTG